MGYEVAPKVEPPAHVSPDQVFDFDVYNSTKDPDPHRAWKVLQAPGVPDIVWTPRNGGHWIAVRGKLIGEAFADYEAFSSRIKQVPKSRGEQYPMIPSTVDPPVHRPYRLLLNASLSPAAVATLEPTIHELAERFIDAFAETGECDFTAQYAEQLPIQVFLKMCDLPGEDGPMLKKVADQFTRPDGTMTLAEGVAYFQDYLRETVIARREAPGDDILSRIVAGQVDGEMLSVEQSLRVLPQVLVAGLDTVVNFLNYAMLFLAENPEERRALIADPALLAPAVNELLRRYPLVTATRVVARDMVFGGAELKEGDMIVLPTILHGLDERENACPMDVDFKRGPGEHSTFGRGHHFCPGSYLARAEVRITLETWLRRIPEFRVKPGAQVRYRAGLVSTIEALPLVWDVP